MATTSRPSYVAAIYLVACCTLAFAAEPPAKDDKSKPPAVRPKPTELISKETAASPAAAAEIKQLVGSWQLVEHVKDGKKLESREKIVITPTWICWSDRGAEVPLTFRFRLDPSKSPKQADLQWTMPYAREPDDEASTIGEPKPMIYELAGDTFRLCFGDFERRIDKSIRFLRPDGFTTAPDTNRELRVHKRCPDIATFPVKTDEEVDAEILKALDGWIALLAAKEYQKFYTETSATELATREISELEAAGLEQILLQFRAARRLVPTISDGGKRAVFDLTVCHIPGVDTWVIPYLPLKRVNGNQWKFANH